MWYNKTDEKHITQSMLDNVVAKNIIKLIFIMNIVLAVINAVIFCAAR